MARGPGRLKQGDESSAMLTAAKHDASELKRSAYALAKAPEHLTDNQKLHLKMIAQKNPALYRAYLIKESLRLLLKLDDADKAAKALKSWLWWTSHSRVPAICELARKVPPVQAAHSQHDSS